MLKRKKKIKKGKKRKKKGNHNNNNNVTLFFFYKKKLVPRCNIDILRPHLPPTNRGPHPNIQPGQTAGPILARASVQTPSPGLVTRLIQNRLDGRRQGEGAQRNDGGPPPHRQTQKQGWPPREEGLARLHRLLTVSADAKELLE